MTRLSYTRRTAQFAKSFWKDTSGIMMPYIATTLVAIIALSLLAIDGGRFMSLQTQMQAAADALALTGAAELDQQPGAITRANNAISNLVSNGLFGMGISTPVGSATPSFYETLPAANQPLSSGTVATTDVAARFVAVTVTPVTVETIFPVTYLLPSGTNSFTGGAQAVAGSFLTLCKPAPMFICNPYGGANVAYDTATQNLIDANSSGTLKQTLIRLAPPAAGKTYGPGDFGYVAPPGGSWSGTCGSNAGNGLARAMASSNPPVCVAQNATSIDLQTGNLTPVMEGFNTRFDIYDNSFKHCTSDYPPDVNVRKGYVAGGGGTPDWCSALPDNTFTNQTGATTAGFWQPGTYPKPVNTVTPNGTTSTTRNQSTITGVTNTNGIAPGMQITGTGIPTDTIVLSVNANQNKITISNNVTTSGTYTFTISMRSMGLPLDNCFYTNTCGGNGNIGDGQWDCLTYWNAVHPAGHAWDNTIGQCGSGTGLSPTTVSRYKVYQYEISQGWLNDTPTPPPGSRETGAPQCNAGAGTANRRLIYVGIVNCGSTGVTIASNGTVPVAGFGKFFITQPFASGNPTTTAYLYGEFTDLVLPRRDPNVHQSVQLYR